MVAGNALTPFTHLPGDILTGLQKARGFARDVGEPITVMIAVPQRPGLPAYMVARAFWSATYEEVVVYNKEVVAAKID